MRRFEVDLLQTLLFEKLSCIHKARLQCFWGAVLGLLLGGRLWLTALGRSLPTSALPKHRIKTVDRLLGNVHLHGEAALIYAACAQIVLRRAVVPLIAVDWTEHGTLCTLSAAVIYDKRAVPIYNEVHPRKKLGNERIQHAFLNTLRRILPAEVTPIIVTDAGFQRPWLDAVTEMNWFFVSRIRNKTLFFDGKSWRPTQSLYPSATSKPRSLGVVQLRRERPAAVRLVLFKKPLKGRTNMNKRGQRSRRTEIRKCRQRNRDPWLLAASPTLPWTPRQIVDLYGARFQIEQTFRDKKNARFGWAAAWSRAQKPARLAVLYLIATVAKIACELIGIIAEKQGLQRQFQANTERRRRVLSRFTLAQFVVLAPDLIRPHRYDVHDALKEFQQDVAAPLLAKV
jgi:hypothetical protein